MINKFEDIDLKNRTYYFLNDIINIKNIPIIIKFAKYSERRKVFNKGTPMQIWKSAYIFGFDFTLKHVLRL